MSDSDRVSIIRTVCESISCFLQIVIMNSNYLHVSLNQIFLSGICFTVENLTPCDNAFCLKNPRRIGQNDRNSWVFLNSEKESSSVGYDFPVKSTDSFQKKYLLSNENKFTWNHLYRKPQFGGFRQKISSTNVLDDLIELFVKYF